MEITNKQYLVLDYIKKFIASNGYSPTVREICNGLALKSPSTVHEHLKNLELKGVLIMNPKKSRTIELLVENEYLNTETDIVKVSIYNDELKFMSIPKFMLKEYNPNKLRVYNMNNHTYIINTSLKEDNDLGIGFKVISEIITY